MFELTVQPMLPHVLATDFDFERFAEVGALETTLAEAERRRLASLDGVDLWSCPWSVVDIETTGSVSGRDGLTEIALVRVREGRIEHRWRTFVNPLQPIPQFITHLTGISDDMVRSAPHIREILDDITGFVGDDILVGHNVRFDAGFINYELRRHGRRPIANPLVDTLALSRRTIAEVPNYKLGTLTRELGFDVERHHRALADAVATAELLVYCIRRLEDRGIFTFGALRDYLRSRALRRRRPAAARAMASVTQLPVWTSILRDELETVPSKPGVYLLKDAGNEVAYVGKSRNLRQRLRAYASGAKPAGPKIRALRGVVAGFEFMTVGSEFEALLLESELVKAHRPPFNDLLRNFKEFAFIKIEPPPFARIVTTTRVIGDGARYYGPYRSIAAARAAVAALQEALGLRSYDDPLSAAGSMPEGHYEALVDEAVAFIEGAADDVLLAIARRRDEAAARNKFEIVEREERRLDRLRRMRERNEALSFATGLHMLVLAPSIDPAEETCFVFCGGRLVAQQRLPRRLPYRGQARELLAQVVLEKFKPDESPRSFARQDEIDQVHILANWFRDRREGLAYVELPDRTPSATDAGIWAAAVLDGQELPC